MRALGDTATIPDLIVQAAQQNNVDPALALEVAQAESNMNQNAVSPAGAIGVMQVLPGTAAAYGADPYDTADNIQAGVSYLGDLINQFGDEGTALAAYNWGPGNVQRAIATYGTSPLPFRGGMVPAWFTHAPSETQNYVLKILGNVAFSGPPALLPSTAGASGGQIPSSVSQSPMYASLLAPTVPGGSAPSPWILLAVAGGFLVLLYIANQ